MVPTLHQAIDVFPLFEKGSRMEEAARSLLAVMVERYQWRVVAEPIAAQSARLTLVGADSVDAIARALGTIVPTDWPRTLIVGHGTHGLKAGDWEPRPGTIAELLEATGAIGSLPASAFDEWKPLLVGFIGRKDLLPRIGTHCLKAFQSDRYCLWIDTQGADLPEFLACLAASLPETAAPPQGV